MYAEYILNEYRIYAEYLQQKKRITSELTGSHQDNTHPGDSGRFCCSKPKAVAGSTYATQKIPVL